MRFLLGFFLFLIAGVLADTSTPVAEITHRFGPGPMRPAVPLTVGFDGSLYGVTEGDSAEPAARVFRITSAGEIEALALSKIIVAAWGQASAR